MHGDAPESAEPLVWYSRESYRSAGTYYPRYESANHGKYTFAIRERRRDSRVDLLVRKDGTTEDPIVRYTFDGAREAKLRAERFLVENDLYLN